MVLQRETESWEAVGDAIQARLDELGWEQVDLVRASGISDTTVRRLQRGDGGRFQRSTLTRVALALGWPADAVWRILAGEPAPEPRPVVVEADEPTVDDETLATLADVRAQLERLERRLDRR